DIHYARLKLHPMWNPLRGDPRFEAIVASLAPKLTRLDGHRTQRTNRTGDGARPFDRHQTLPAQLAVIPRNFFSELKRRNIYRAAVLYGMGAWLLAQIATQIFPFFNVPNSAVRFVIVALILGFPIAMVLSWLFELTPEGIVRTEDVDLATQRGFGRKIDFVIIGVLLLVIVMV